MATNKIILYEYQKKRVCEFYGCFDSNGSQYPNCIFKNDKMGVERPDVCHLLEIHDLLDKLNEPQREGE